MPPICVSQPAMFVANLAAVERLRAEDPGLLGRVAFTAGLSLGGCRGGREQACVAVRGWGAEQQG